MGDEANEQSDMRMTFGQRRIRPRACIIDGKKHIRMFLSEAIEEFGLVTCECERTEELHPLLGQEPPDLIILGLSAGSPAAREILTALADRCFAGAILLLGPQDSPVVAAVEELARELRLTILPTLHTPFGDAALRNSIAPLLPAEQPPDPPIHVGEAVHAGWLELWYQPKIDSKTLALCGAEALVRVRHPNWGVVPPAYFIPDDQDPDFRILSEYVIARALADWHDFVVQHGPLQIAINLPIAFLRQPECLKRLCRQMPAHPAFPGMIVEIDAAEVVDNLELIIEIARQLRFHNIAVSADDLGQEWPGLMALSRLPFAELKVDPQFVAGCADAPLKRTVCRSILELAKSCGTRTVAEGVEMQADFLAVREMGFDMVQGFLFARPAPAKKFARKTLGSPVRMRH